MCAGLAANFFFFFFLQEIVWIRAPRRSTLQWLDAGEAQAVFIATPPPFFPPQRTGHHATMSSSPSFLPSFFFSHQPGRALKKKTVLPIPNGYVILSVPSSLSHSPDKRSPNQAPGSSFSPFFFPWASPACELTAKLAARIPSFLFSNETNQIQTREKRRHFLYPRDEKDEGEG